MRTSRTLHGLSALALALTLGACGDDGGTPPPVDAPPAVDAPPGVDAPPAVPVWSALTGEGNLNAAFVYTANGDIYAVIGGAEKTVCKWDEATQAWVPQTAPNANLEPAFVIDANGGIVAKVANSICRWDEATQTWLPVAPAGATGTMVAAFEYEADDNIRAIIDGAVHQWDGLTWTAMTGVGNLRPAFVYSNGNYYAVLGDEAGPKTVCMWNEAGQSWDPQTNPTDTLETAFVIDANGAIVAKVGGSICRWNPDTQAWDPVAPAPAGSTMLAAFEYTDDTNIKSIIDGMVQQWAVP